MSAGQMSVQEVINCVTDAFLERFPGRVLAIYSTGSYSGGYAVAGSDLDLALIFSGEVAETERKQGAHLVEELSDLVSLELDLVLLGEVEEIRPALKFDSTLVQGTDVRDRLRVMSTAYWIRERMYGGGWLICHLFGRRGVAEIPITFPSASGEFFGYNTDRGGAVSGPEGSTKDLVRATSWAATAIVGQKSGGYVTSKAHLQSKLRDHLPQEWASFIEVLFTFCRRQTSYGIPKDANGRKKLRELCSRTREFEDYFLNAYREFLLDELVADVERTSEALERIEETPFQDEAIRYKITSTDWRKIGLAKVGEKALLATERCYC